MEGEESVSFPRNEEEVLAYWKKIGAFKKSLELSVGKPEYTFYDGPPFATGLPHYGHILAGTIKDTVTRYAHQTGHHVSRRFGWDCHGLPVEYEIDKTLGLTGRDDVLEMGIGTYNGHCRGIVQRYTKEWETVVTRLGRWIDFENDYRTMDPSFMESVWWVFKTLYDKGLVYKGYKVMPYSTACSTPLSNFEAGLNYKDCKDPAVVVSFPLLSSDKGGSNYEGASLVAWTTTPWTLPSNLALCVNPDFDYVRVKDVQGGGKVYIVAEARLEQLFPALRAKGKKKKPEKEIFEKLDGDKKIKGSELVGLKYEPLFDFLLKDDPSLKTRAFKVLADGYVTSDAGTGIVHQAPAFGEDDFRVCVSNKIVTKEHVPCPVDANGRFSHPVSHSDLLGKHVKEADSGILKLLKEKGRLVVNEQIDHSYPFCWRSDTPLIYKVVPSIFVRVEDLKDKLLANNAKTYWVPATVKEKRFHNWLAEARDWAISRNRFWGTPIPLFESADGSEVVAVGSVEELLALNPTRNGQPVTQLPDLHRESIDDLVLKHPTKPNVELKRVDEVFDCWFESGSMPYAQIHYPFCDDPDEQTFLKDRFPADFIAEGIDQTRGWFYTLTVIATALYDRPAFKNLVVNGIVLAEDGKKMSKRLKNYPDPSLVIDEHGADALRLYLIDSPVVKGDNLRFSQDGVRQVLRDVMLPWFNAARFFTLQAERWKQANARAGGNDAPFARDRASALNSTNVTDLWVLAEVRDLTAFVHEEMRAYRLYTVVPRLVAFLSDLTNWYVRLNRARLKGGDGDDVETALAVLFEVLLHMAQLMAPFTPFFAEYLYQRLRTRLPEFKDKSKYPEDALGAADSIHFVELPKAEPPTTNSSNASTALRGVHLLQKVVELGRKAREEAKINMKTPVRSVTVVATSPEDVDALAAVRGYVLSELNAWDLDVTSDVDAWCTLSADPKLPDFAKAFSKSFGKKSKDAQAAVRQLKSQHLRGLLAGDTPSLSIAVDDVSVQVGLEHLLVKTSFAGTQEGFVAQTSPDGALTVAVDVRQDDALRNQGIAREVVNRVNKLRKKAKLALGHQVDVFYADQDADSCALPTAAALEANAQLLNKANIRPLPACHKSCHARVLASDVAPTPFGSKMLSVTICKPTPSLSSAASARAVEQRGQHGEQALECLVSLAKPEDTVLKGVLDGIPFELHQGTDFFLDATSKVANLNGTSQP